MIAYTVSDPLLPFGEQDEYTWLTLKIKAPRITRVGLYWRKLK